MLGHTGDNLKKGIHGVFDGGRQVFLETVEEFWMHVWEQSISLVSISTNGSRTTYTVDMGREIGYVGVSRAQAPAHRPKGRREFRDNRRLEWQPNRHCIPRKGAMIKEDC